MQKFKHFMAIGSAALALSIPTVSQATDTSLSQRFSIVNDSQAVASQDFVSMTQKLQKETIDTLNQAYDLGLIKREELPTTFKVAIVDEFLDTEQGSHYSETNNELKVSYGLKIDDNAQYASVNQFLSLMYAVPELSNINISEKLLNQFVFLHELSHSVNHHHDNHTFAFNDPNTSLNKKEQGTLTQVAANMLDENFADTYGAIIFLKINHFSQDSIDTLKAIATLRDYTIKQKSNLILGQPDKVEDHASFYSLSNVLSNLDTLKHTQNIDTLRLLANQYSSNGTSLAYQKYQNYHHNSFADNKIHDVSELIMLDAYNRINANENGFKPIEINWESRHRQEVVEKFVSEKLKQDDVLSKNFTLKKFDPKDIQKTITLLRTQAGITDESMGAYSLVRGTYSIEDGKKSPDYMKNAAKELISQDSILTQEIETLSHIDKKMNEATESAIMVDIKALRQSMSEGLTHSKKRL